ncbi:MAG TPA: DUF2303 family protein [Planctomycetota bacterium]|nr:DUF2303 family protein [Planctomycetota bacterium]
MGREEEKPTSRPEADVILKAGQAMGRPNEVPGYKPFAIVPEGAKMVELTHQEPVPLPGFIKQKISFRDVKALIAYVNRFKTTDTQAFADERAGTITAIIDYHLADDSNPDRCAHVATFTAEASPEWKEWKALDGKPQTQERFAEFMENQAPFIVRPSAAEMLEIASSFQASSSASFSKAIRLDNGQVQLQYVEQINGQAGPKGALQIPKSFDVQLRPFVGCNPTRIEARFRYRIEGGRLSLWFDLFRADDVQRESFDVIRERVKDETGIETYLGAAAL